MPFLHWGHYRTIERVHLLDPLGSLKTLKPQDLRVAKAGRPAGPFAQGPAGKASGGAKAPCKL